MSEHTPGPWAVIPPDEDCRTWFIGRDRLGAPLGVIPEHIDDGLPYYIAVFGVLMEAERAEANAYLIAAAPDLLAACASLVANLPDEIFEWIGDSISWSNVSAIKEAREAAKVAIATARGE